MIILQVYAHHAGSHVEGAPQVPTPGRKGERVERELPKLQCEALRGQGRHVGGKRGDSAHQKGLKHTFYIQAHHYFINLSSSYYSLFMQVSECGQASISLIRESRCDNDHG